MMRSTSYYYYYYYFLTPKPRPCQWHYYLLLLLLLSEKRNIPLFHDKEVEFESISLDPLILHPEAAGWWLWWFWSLCLAVLFATVDLRRWRFPRQTWSPCCWWKQSISLVYRKCLFSEKNALQAFTLLFPSQGMSLVLEAREGTAGISPYCQPRFLLSCGFPYSSLPLTHWV